MSLINYSTGILFHFNAVRYAKLWERTRTIITIKCLKYIPPLARNVLFLAPSGSYTFDVSRLQHLQLSFVDIDYIAKFAISDRVHTKFKFIYTSIESFLRKNEKSYDFIYVGNVLGQNIKNKKELAELLQSYLKDKNFFIQYDRFSFEVPVHDKNLVTRLDWADPEEWNENWKELNAFGLKDHGTKGLFDGFYKEYVIWEIKPCTFHLVELVGNRV